MIEQTILHLIVKSSLLYVIRNRSYIVNAGKTAHFLLNFGCFIVFFHDMCNASLNFSWHYDEARFTTSKHV